MSSNDEPTREQRLAWLNQTPDLHAAVGRRDLAGVRELLSRGDDVNHRDPRPSPWDGETPLLIAAALGHVEMVELLMAHGADVNARSATGWTALIAACNAGNTEIARMLLDAGADPAARNDEGYTAFGRVPGDATKLVRLMAERDAALL